ncbi:MAG: PepSY domain-containing protein [Brevundimonas sp.]|uniref:PepSY domain-containing protein n=1 Tax=Brevundimonas sp. TaxID=1871086 RepID=UPI00391BB16C
MSALRLLAALSLTAALATPAMADDDRPPTAEERTAIEAKLRAEGFVRWEDIELDDGLWEVDDAVTRDGREYDLKLRPGTLEIVRRDLDD